MTLNASWAKLLANVAKRRERRAYPTKERLFVVLVGGPYRIRTCDRWIKSPLLYQLS